MSIFYVAPSGSNSNNGTTAALAKQTLVGVNSISSILGAGDTVRIAPGTYREKFTATAINQTLQFDPLAQWFPGLSPGICRISGAGTDEKPTAGTVISCGTYAGLTIAGYLVNGQPWLPIIDGTTGVAAAGTVTNPITCNYVSSQQCGTAFSYSTCSGCVGFGTSSAFSNCNSTNCIGFTNSTSGAYLGNGSATNCLAIGGYGYVGGSTGLTAKNSKAWLCVYGFQGTGAGGESILTLTNCEAQQCTYAYVAANNSYPLVLSNNCYYCGGTASFGTVTGSATAVGSDIYSTSMLIRALEPIMSLGTFQLGASGGAASDILGLAPTSPATIGPYQYPVVTRLWQSNIPMIPRGVL